MSIRRHRCGGSDGRRPAALGRAWRRSPEAQLGPQHRRIAHPRQDLPKADRGRPYAITTGAALVLFVPAVKSSVNRRGDLSWNRSARGRSGYVSLHAVQPAGPAGLAGARMLGIGRLPGGQPIQDLPPPVPYGPGRSRAPRLRRGLLAEHGRRQAPSRSRAGAPRRRPGPPPGLRVYGADPWRSTAGDEAPSRSSSGAPPPSAGTRQTSVTIGVGADASGRAYRIVESSSHSA